MKGDKKLRLQYHNDSIYYHTKQNGRNAASKAIIRMHCNNAIKERILINIKKPEWIRESWKVHRSQSFNILSE